MATPVTSDAVRNIVIAHIVSHVLGYEPDVTARAATAAMGVEWGKEPKASAPFKEKWKEVAGNMQRALATRFKIEPFDAITIVQAVQRYFQETRDIEIPIAPRKIDEKNLSTAGLIGLVNDELQNRGLLLEPESPSQAAAKSSTHSI